jgi:hypothetical protein
MKRLIPAKSTRIGPVNLYLEEVTELVAIFNGYCETVEISDDKAVYDSLDEAAQKINKKIIAFEIAGKNPDVKLSFKNNGSWLSQQFSKPQMEPAEIDRYDLVYSRVKDFVTDHISMRSFLNWAGLGLAIFGGLGFLSLKILSSNSKGLWPWIIPSAWIAFALYTSSNQTFQNRIGYVSLKPRATTSFWAKNADGVKMLAIGTLLGVAATLLAEWVKHSIWEK